MSEYVSFEENIKNGLLLFAQDNLDNKDDFLYDLFELYPIDQMSSLFYLINDRASLLNELNHFLEDHYPILDRRRERYIKDIKDKIGGAPLAVAISLLVGKRLEIEEIVANEILLKQIELYYKNLLHSLNLLISTYRGFIQFDVSHKKELSLYDKFGAFLISHRHNISFLKQCNELESQAMEVFLDRCIIVKDEVSYIARVPFELTKEHNINIDLVPRKEISKKLCYYQLNLFDTIVLPPLKKNTLLSEDEFKNILYKYFKFLNEKVTEDDIIVFMQTVKNQMHEKYSWFDRNRVRFLLNKIISEHSEANLLFCAVIYKLLIDYIGNKDNLYNVLSAYFSYEVAGVNLSKSTLERYIGIQEYGEKLLRNLDETVKDIANS